MEVSRRVTALVTRVRMGFVRKKRRQREKPGLLEGTERGNPGREGQRESMGVCVGFLRQHIVAR